MGWAFGGKLLSYTKQGEQAELFGVVQNCLRELEVIAIKYGYYKTTNTWLDCFI